MITGVLSELIDELGLCGCGDPEGVAMLYRNGLRALDTRSDAAELGE